MDALGRFWAQVTATTPDLRPQVLLGTAAVAAVLVLSPTLWRPTRHVVTIAHEGAHGLVALAAGRRLSGIRLHSDTSGLTVSAGQPSGPGHGAHLRGRLHRARRCSAWARPRSWPPGTPIGLLWALLLLLALLLVQIRNWYGLWSVLVTGAVVFGATWWLPPEGQAAFAALATWFLLLAAPRTVAGAADLPPEAAGAATPTPTSWPGSRPSPPCSGSASSCSSTSARCCSAGTGC